MSIIPGIENLAPDRTLTSSGSDGSPSRRFIAFSRRPVWRATSSVRPAGQPPRMWSRQASVLIVNPGGTGRLSTEVISARLAPLPPRRSFISIGGFLWR